jgi:hypothetical protein
VSGVILTLVLAQAAPASAGQDAATLERIREALAKPPPLSLPAPSLTGGGPVFRVTIRGWTMDPPWKDSIPAYLRTPMPSYHHEFLSQVTDERFRGATLYPTGIPVVPMVEVLSKIISKALRKAQERRAREEVAKALADLLACRENPTRPGC